MARVKRAVNAQKKRRTTLERAAGYRGQAHQSPSTTSSTTRTPPVRYRGSDYGH